MKPVHTYQETVTLGLPLIEHRECLRAINAAHGHVVTLDSEDPEALRDAHYRLASYQQQTVTIGVFADGSRRIIEVS